MSRQKARVVQLDDSAVNDSHTPLDRASLERRLDDGYRRIEEARVQGRDVRAWEDFWIHLLHEYEEICDGLRRAA